MPPLLPYKQSRPTLQRLFAALRLAVAARNHRRLRTSRLSIHYALAPLHPLFSLSHRKQAQYDFEHLSHYGIDGLKSPCSLGRLTISIFFTSFSRFLLI